MSKVLRSCGTHDGSFHADEVTACALLHLFDLIDADKIHRTRDPEILHQCEFVCDVGGIYESERKLFDHHQVEYDGSLSSAGMILLYLKESKIIDESEFEFFNRSLIKGVDAHDNGIELAPAGVCTYSHIISNFMPINYESSNEARNKAFMEAFYFARDHLDRLLRRRRYIQLCCDQVKKAMLPKSDFLLFDEAIPWMDSFFELGGINHPAKFVVMPTGTHWKLRGIPPSQENHMLVRMPLPQDWSGLMGDDFKNAVGIEGAIFCHKGRFISIWENKQDALSALEIVLKQG